MTKFDKLLIQIIIILATIVLTILGFEYAGIERGYSAIGGEALIPIYGIVTFMLLEEIKTKRTIPAKK